VYFKHNLRRSIEEFAAGNRSHFARMTGVSLDSIYRWLEVDRYIRLDSFLRMCCNLRFSAVRFLTEYIAANDLDWARARGLAQQILCRKPRRPTSFYPQRVPERAMNAEVSRLRTQDSIRERFERVLCEPAPRALETIAKDLGLNNSSSLYNRCPDLCRAMVSKNRCWRQQEDERIREAITKALLESPAPLMKEVASRLGYTVTALRARFPALSAALAARIPERRLFERERMRERLRTALELKPAASMKDVVQSLGRCDCYLQTIFPGLCRQITNRYFEEKRRASAERKLQFCAEIHNAVVDLCKRGINPSRKHVFAVIVNPSMRCSHTLDQQIAQTLGDL
jgi:AraC-like DNA-binding protein